MLPIERDELAGARREEDALLQNLHLRAQLEQLAGRRVVGVVHVHALQHVLHGIAGGGFDGALVDRAGENEVRAHDEHGGGGLRRADAARSADVHAAEARREGCALVPDRQDRGQQRQRHALIGVAAAVGLDADRIGHRHLPRKLRFAGRQGPARRRSFDRIASGAGDRNCSATSGRDTLAMILCRA